MPLTKVPTGTYISGYRVRPGRRLGGSPGDPEERGMNPRELRGNCLANVVSELCWRLHRRGCFFSVENPKGSYVRGYGPIADLLEVGWHVDFHQCMYGLTPPHLRDSNPDNKLIKKPTRLLTNVPTLKRLSVFCDGSHDHFECLGTVKVDNRRVSVASAAGEYPGPLCAAWASLVASAARD